MQSATLTECCIQSLPHTISIFLQHFTFLKLTNLFSWKACLGAGAQGAIKSNFTALADVLQKYAAGKLQD